MASSHAGIIFVDPDDDVLPSSPNFRRLLFDDLNGTALDGSSLDLEFVFSDSKFLELLPGGSPLYAIEVLFLTDSTVGISPPALPTGALTFFGSEIATEQTRGSSGNSIAPASFGYLLNFDRQLFSQHSGVNFSITLPTLASTDIVGAELSFFGADTVVQGSAAVVPEPTSMAAFFLMVPLLFGRGWRRICGFKRAGLRSAATSVAGPAVC